MVYDTLVSTDFANKVKAIAGKPGRKFSPDDLMYCMHFETGGTFKPSEKNKSTGATGLIQFMPKTAVGLGTTTAALAAMSQVQQLDYVDKYIANQEAQYGKMKNLGDLYLSIFYPAAIKWKDSQVFPDSVYKVNKVFDVKKRGYMTKGDVVAMIEKKSGKTRMSKLKTFVVNVRSLFKSKD